MFEARAGVAKRFLKDTSGIAAIEMAFIAPVALFLLSIGVAAGQMQTIDHKVVLAAHSITDLVSRTVYQVDANNAQGEVLAEADLDTDLAFSQLLLYPNSSTNLLPVVSELLVNSGNNTASVVWSEALPGSGATPLPCSTVIQLDPSYALAGAKYLLYGSVSYSFQPLGGVLSLPMITLSSTETLTIRNAQQIDITNVTTSSFLSCS